MKRLTLIVMGTALLNLALAGLCRGETVTIDNDYVRIIIDESTGNIAELTWKAGSNKQLIDRWHTDRYNAGSFRLASAWGPSGYHEDGSTAVNALRGFNGYSATFKNPSYGTKTLDIRWGKEGVYVKATFNLTRPDLLVGCLWQPGGDHANDYVKIHPTSGEPVTKDITYSQGWIHEGELSAMGIGDSTCDEMFGYRSSKTLTQKVGAGGSIDGPIVYLPKGESVLEFALTSKSNFDKFAAGKWDIPASATPVGGLAKVLTLHGESLVGNVIGIEGGKLSLTGPQFEGEVQLLASALNRVSPLSQTIKSDGPDRVQLTNGDYLGGKITAVTADSIVLSSQATGTLNVPRKMVSSISFSGRQAKDAPKAQVQNYTVCFANKDMVSATSISVADGVLVAETAYGQLRCPVEKVANVVFASKGQEQPRRRSDDVTIQTAGSKFTIGFAELSGEFLSGQADHLGSVKVKRGAIKEVVFNIYSK